jgi:hypothetical protein
MKKRNGRALELSDFLIEWDEEEAEARSIVDLEMFFAKEAARSQPSKPSS